MKNRIYCFILISVVIISVMCGCGNDSDITETTTYSTTYNDVTTAEVTSSFAETEKSYLIPDGAVLLTDYASYVSGNDWAPALETALADSETVFIPAGRYDMSRVVIPSGSFVCGEGEKTEIYQIDGAEQLFNIQGNRPKASNLAVDKKDFSDTFTLKADIGLKPGDTVYILGQRNCMLLEDCGYDWCLGRSYASGTACFYSEFLTVKSVSGKTVTTEESTLFPYYLANGTGEHDPLKPTTETSDWPYKRSSTTVYLVNFVENVTLRDFNVYNASGFSVYAVFARNLVVDNVNMYTSKDVPSDDGMCFVRLLDCLDCDVRNCDFSFPVKPDAEKLSMGGDFNAYATLKILSSVRSGFTNCSSDFGAFGYLIAKKHTNGISLDCYIRNCTSTGAVWGGTFVSQGTYRTEISDCDFTSPIGIMCAGRGAVIKNNCLNASQVPADSYAFVKNEEGGRGGILLTEGYSVDSIVTGNIISGFDTAFIVRDGYEKTNIFEKGKIDIYENTADGCMTALRIWKNASNKNPAKLDFSFTGNTFTATQNSCEAIILDGYNFGITATDNVFHGFTDLLKGINTTAMKNIFEPNVFD